MANAPPPSSFAATAMTMTSLVSPEWVTLTVPSPSGGAVTDSIGLHRRCSASSPSSAAGGGGGGGRTCAAFPERWRCEGDERAFCSMWRTTGFLMNLAVVAELAALAGFVVVLAGGRVKREGSGWKALGGMLAVVAAAEFLAMAIVAYAFDHDDLFLVPGYRLDLSWYLCTFSAGIALLAGVGLAISALVLPPEDGYQLLLGESDRV
ncbi:hypothetical protein VTH06DRAFT_1297 [Thermothelomyces fergusii]